MDFEKDFDDGTAKVDAGKLHFRHHSGSGKTLVFLHGLGANVRTWKKLVEFLPDTYNIYLLDLLGHGKSDAPRIDYTVSMQAGTLMQFIEEEKIANPYLFGHSYGGWIAVYFGARFGAAGLILEDTAGLKEAFDQIAEGGKQNNYIEDLFRDVMKMNANKDYVIRSILQSDFKREEELSDEMLAKIAAPTLILWGSRDLTLSPEMAGMLQKKIKGSGLEIIEGAGHVAHYTHPEKVAEAVNQFLSAH